MSGAREWCTLLTACGTQAFVFVGFCCLQAQFGVAATKPWCEPAEKSSFERNFFLRRQAGSGQPLKKVPFRETLKG